MANETMVLNTKPKDNTMFYGTAYASGVTTIKADRDSLFTGCQSRKEYKVLYSA
jgi:hypothetical protein